MPLHPAEYARLLGEKIDRHGVKVWLINTGWTGGPYGVGSRIKLGYTRQMVTAALTGALDEIATTEDPYFGLQVPVHVSGVPDEVLRPRQTWADPQAYDQQAQKLVGMFAENFKKFQDRVGEGVHQAGP
jgi:phosphoenolpyruvate carboxykinase (ATP)